MRYDGSFSHELPGVRKMEYRAGYSPNDDNRQGQNEGCGRSRSFCRFAGELFEKFTQSAPVIFHNETFPG